MIKKLDIYFIKKFLGTFIFALSLIICIAVIFDASEKLDDFLEKKAPFSAIIFEYYLNFIPYFSVLFSYLFVFISVVLFTSKMAYNSEFIAILSNGISYRRILLPYFISATIIAGCSFLLGNYIIPKSNSKRFVFEEKYYRNSPYKYFRRNIHKQIEPGVFVFMEYYNNESNIGYKFALERFENGMLKSKLLADHIIWDSVSNKWRLMNCFSREINGLEEKIYTKMQIDTAIRLSPLEFKQRDNIVEAMSLGEINRQISEMKLQGDTNITFFQIEKAKRFAFPFSSFILTLIGVTVSSRKVRGGMGFHLAIGLLLSFSYIFFLQCSSQFAISGLMSPTLAIWIPNILYAFIGLILYYYTPK